MAGYAGYSMSNNAVYAYSCGEKPLSKWTKSAIIEQLEEFAAEGYEINVAGFKKLKADTLRRNLLKKSSWHHTSSYYNCTDFYEVDDQLALYVNDRLDNLLAADKASKAETKEEPVTKRVRAKYLVWTGTRRYPKATECVAEGEIKGNWFYPDGESFKKSIDAKGFAIVETL